MSLGLAIKNLRLHLKWSQRRLANEVGLQTAVSISQYEKEKIYPGRRKRKEPSLRVYRKIFKLAQDNNFLENFLKIASSD